MRSQKYQKLADLIILTMLGVIMFVSKYMTEALERSVLSKGIEIIDRQRVIRILTEDNAVTVCPAGKGSKIMAGAVDLYSGKSSVPNGCEGVLGNIPM